MFTYEMISKMTQKEFHKIVNECDCDHMDPILEMRDVLGFDEEELITSEQFEEFMRDYIESRRDDFSTYEEYGTLIKNQYLPSEGKYFMLNPRYEWMEPVYEPVRERNYYRCIADLEDYLSSHFGGYEERHEGIFPTTIY